MIRMTQFSSSIAHFWMLLTIVFHCWQRESKGKGNQHGWHLSYSMIVRETSIPGYRYRALWLVGIKTKRVNLAESYWRWVEVKQNFSLRPLAKRLSAETKITARKDGINKIICKRSCTLEEWSGFFPVQIHHINVVILETKAKKILKLHRNIDKSCIKKQKWHEIINRYALQHNLPARKKIIGTSDILHHEEKVVLGLQTPFYNV